MSLILLHQKPAVNSVRYNSRWAHRKPGKVILPFEPTGTVKLKKERVINLDPSVLKKSQAPVSKTQGPVLKTQVPKTSKVINADSRDEIIDDQPASTFDSKKSKKIITAREEKMKKHNFYLSQKKVFGDNGEIIYEKMNENDGRVR